MQVSTDTYVTVAEADTYVLTRYRSISTARTRWTALPESDKEILLKDACGVMEQLPFHGYKAKDGQLLAFPRQGQDEVPEAVKAAQVEIALWLSDDASQAEAEKRRALQAQGVTTFSIDDLSETYGRLSSNRVPLPLRAQMLLARYLNGAYVAI